MMRKFSLTLAGGFCGATTRYMLSAPLLRLASELPGAHAAFPYDILFINLSGAMSLGFLFGLFEHGAPVSPDVRLTLGTGFLGAFTTFSSYMVGADLMLTHGQMVAGILYALGSMVGGIVLTFIGFRLAGAGWRSWRGFASALAPDVLLVDGGWEDRSEPAQDAALARNVSAPAPAGSEGERWSR